MTAFFSFSRDQQFCCDANSSNNATKPMPGCQKYLQYYADYLQSSPPNQIGGYQVIAHSVAAKLAFCCDNDTAALPL